MVVSRSLLMSLVILLAVAAGCTVATPATPTAAPAVQTSMHAPEAVPTTIVQGYGCTDTVCSAFPPQTPAQDAGLFHIRATPVRYSPLLSSTPGICLSLNSSRVPSASAEYMWNASYGTFLSWNPPDYSVRLLGPEVVNREEKLYWTFSEAPEPAQEPVHIMVTATDPLTQAVTGSAVLTLEWDGGTAVVAGDIH